MDEVSEYNIKRWKEMAEAGAIFTLPRFDLTAESAREVIDRENLLGELAGKKVLLLAGGGGQQSASYGLLGARVTVLDISESQLVRDRETAQHYGLDIETISGDMRDLSQFGPDLFDIVDHAYSLNFVPEVQTVFHQVFRVVRPGGMYSFGCANPFFIGVKQTDWNGEGYVLRTPYIDGAEILYEDEKWVFREQQPAAHVRPCREFRHTLSTLVNGLIETGFIIRRIMEQNLGEPDVGAEPASTDHFTAYAPPWLKFWTVKSS